jgi:O-6-methylguanine DNA methyltransferase
MKQPKNLKLLNSQKQVHHYQSPIGQICYEVEHDKLVKMYFCHHDNVSTNVMKSDIMTKINHFLDAYFSHKPYQIDTNLLDYKGTLFQRSVYQALLEIKYGETKSYQDIAIILKNKNLVRAVGQACKKNPIGIIVPCHRVIHKDGQLGGYSGFDEFGFKRKLLNHEKKE